MAENTSSDGITTTDGLKMPAMPCRTSDGHAAHALSVISS